MSSFPKFALHYLISQPRRGARVVEEARLESVYTSKGYREFESHLLRKIALNVRLKSVSGFFLLKVCQ